MRHGAGKHVYADKRVYDGMWQSDKRHGYGVYVLANGDKYEGNWKKDFRDGKGKLTYVDGRVCEDTSIDDWLSQHNLGDYAELTQA